MMQFEILGVGFDGTSDRVLWVSAASRAQLDEYLVGVPVQSVKALDLASPAMIDYRLPHDAIALREKLQEFNKPEQRLVDLLNALLDCADLQLEGLEDDTVEACFNANLYLTTHYPKA